MKVSEKEISVFLNIHHVEQIGDNNIIIDIEALAVDDNNLVPHIEILFKLGNSEQKATTDSNGRIRNEFVFKLSNENILFINPLNCIGKKVEYHLPIINRATGKVKYLKCNGKIKMPYGIAGIIWHAKEKDYFQKGEIIVSIQYQNNNNNWATSQVVAIENGYLKKIIIRGSSEPMGNGFYNTDCSKNAILGEYIAQK